MRNLRLQRAFTKKNDTIGRVKPKGRCKKHPKHNQSPGVCSLCLREKLSQLSSFSSNNTTFFVANDGSSSSSSYVSSLSSYYSSSSVSSCASPLHCFCFNSEGKSGYLSIFFVSGQHEIIKNKSFSRRRECEGGVEHGNNKRSSFWFKLFQAKRNQSEG
uniref:Uncharacterized protein LOC101507869 n=1 Tax=Cicer arietinum TaxID=3827 RepID=A0A1S2XJS1_CICAR|nr:uncharacterized protein LOC101507869 [Cicer arietinum]